MRAELISALVTVPIMPYDLHLTPKLSPEERARHARNEEKIAAHLDSFEICSEALLDERDNMLFRETHATFADYLRDRWKIGPRRAQQIMAGREVVKKLAEANPGALLPANEKQTRALAGLPEREQSKVWERAVDDAGGSQPSARQVTEAREREVPSSNIQAPEKPQTSSSKWPKPNEHGVYRDSDAETTLRFKHSLASADVRVLQAGESLWISAFRYTYRTGSCGSNTCGLSKEHGVPCSDRGTALHRALRRLRDDAAQTVRSESGEVNAKQRRVAKLLVTWCGTELRKIEGGPAAGAETSNGEVEAGVAYVAAQILSVIEKARGRAVGWLLASKMERRVCTALARWHLDQLKNLSVKQDLGPRRKRISAAARALMTARARARWKLAKAAIKQPRR